MEEVNKIHDDLPNPDPVPINIPQPPLNGGPISTIPPQPIPVGE